MKNTVKRMLSGLVAMSMVMGSAISVSAAENTNLETLGSQEVKAENTEVVTPLINVTVSSNTVALQLNPFNLGGTGQINTGNIEIVNNSEIPIAVAITGAKVTPSSGISIVSKAPAATVTEKQALVNLVYTDGTGKATTKALTTEAQDISIATAMTPLGGKVSYKLSGSTTVAPAGGWVSGTDKISVTNTFTFTPQLYTEYNITKTLALYSGVSSEVTLAADDETYKLPSSVLGDSKIEVPVVWIKDGDAEDVHDSTETMAGLGAGTYTAVLKSDKLEGATKSNADVYTVGGTVQFPTIKITEASTT